MEDWGSTSGYYYNFKCTGNPRISPRRNDNIEEKDLEDVERVMGVIMRLGLESMRCPHRLLKNDWVAMSISGKRLPIWVYQTRFQKAVRDLLEPDLCT